MTKPTKITPVYNHFQETIRAGEHARVYNGGIVNIRRGGSAVIYDGGHGFVYDGGLVDALAGATVDIYDGGQAVIHPGAEGTFYDADGLQTVVGQIEYV